jgi:hypothetical protein
MEVNALIGRALHSAVLMRGLRLGASALRILAPTLLVGGTQGQDARAVHTSYAASTNITQVRTSQTDWNGTPASPLQGVC